MKKFVAILLALTLIATCVACSQNMTSGEFKTEFQKFDWENSAPTAVSMEAERLLDMLEDLPVDTQKELSDIRVKLEEYKEVTEENADLEEDMNDDKVLEDDGIMGEDGMLGEEIIPDNDMEENGIMGGNELNARRRILSETIGKKAKPDPSENPEAIQKDARGERPAKGERGERPELKDGEKPEGRPHHPHAKGERPERREGADKAEIKAE